VYLGRPWRAYAKTVFVACELGKHIVPAGWNNWNDPKNEQTAYYAEYKNTGAGSDRSGRVSWSKALTEIEAKEYSIEKIFAAANSVDGENAWFNNHIQVRNEQACIHIVFVIACCVQTDGSIQFHFPHMGFG
jgi:pectinesterase